MLYDTEPVVAATVRGLTVDCVHRASAIIVDAVGRVQYSLGNPDRPTVIRSLAKPFRALTLLSAMRTAPMSLSDEAIALISGSHSGLPEHVELLMTLLSKFHFDVSDLRCGRTLPLDSTRAYEVASGLADRQIPMQCYCDCSGEHFGVLLLCRLKNYPMDGYLRRDHPVHRDYEAILGNAFGLQNIMTDISVDGCGLPTYCVPLRSVAEAIQGAFANVVRTDEEKRLQSAVRKHPSLYAGPQRLTTEIIRASDGKAFVKDGAEAIYGIGFRRQGLALAVKIADGNSRAARAFIPALIRKLALLSPGECDQIEATLDLTIRDNHGDTVGRVVALEGA